MINVTFNDAKQQEHEEERNELEKAPQRSKKPCRNLHYFLYLIPNSQTQKGSMYYYAVVITAEGYGRGI